MCETKNLKNNLTLVSVYFPHSVKINELKGELNRLLFLLDNKVNVIICGDFNARNKAFGDSLDSVRGRTIKQIFEESTFKCLNDGNPTFKRYFNDDKPGSVLDLSFTNSNITLNWSVLNTVIGGSHHFPILIKIHDNTNKGRFFIAKNKLMSNIKQIKLSSNINEIQRDLKHQIKSSTYKLNKNQSPKIWWSEELNKLYRLKQAAQKIFEANKNNINASRLKSAIANFRNAAKTAKKK